MAKQPHPSARGWAGGVIANQPSQWEVGPARWEREGPGEIDRDHNRQQGSYASVGSGETQDCLINDTDFNPRLVGYAAGEAHQDIESSCGG